MMEVILHQGGILREILACVALWWLCSKVTGFILVRVTLDMETIPGTLSARLEDSFRLGTSVHLPMV